ncbi:MAG: hypothetical protein ABIJ81_03185 [Patescibacteria group bacterium]
MIDAYFANDPEWESPRKGVRLHTKFFPTGKDDSLQGHVYVFPVAWPKGNNINLKFRRDVVAGWVPTRGRIWHVGAVGEYTLKFNVPPSSEIPNYEFELKIPGKYFNPRGDIKNYRMMATENV